MPQIKQKELEYRTSEAYQEWPPVFSSPVKGFLQTNWTTALHEKKGILTPKMAPFLTMRTENKDSHRI